MFGIKAWVVPTSSDDPNFQAFSRSEKSLEFAQKQEQPGIVKTEQGKNFIVQWFFLKIYIPFTCYLVKMVKQPENYHFNLELI